MKRITVDLEEALYRRLKIQCVLEDTHITDIVRKLLVEYLDKTGEETKKIKK